MSESAQAVAAMLQGNEADAFAHECAAWCRLGFIRERVQTRFVEAWRSILAIWRGQSVRLPRATTPP